MIAMILVFTVAYPITIHREGFAYQDVILTPSQENGDTIYSGKIQGKQAKFTVFADKTVLFQCGDKTYGPYTAREDSTAIPKDNEQSASMTGVELRQGDEIIFRGGVRNFGEQYLLYNEDGSLENVGLWVVSGDGIARDENGNVIDQMKPSSSTILSLMAGPTLTHKGDWVAWFGGAFFCILTALSILFADEIFRWNLAFQIRNVDRAEPSDWELASRYISWTVLPILALMLFIMGLQ